ncbi:hypothetical protein LTR84_012364 [Exophiala bonariae]|uniref:Cutinase n=1 Tax=Exophiala bonariae TaxID=1690606 RepID=A0AAV9NG07_9EURO|nr:hypothetical protein LTR84_012364 [Exophiala bonariae]
MHSSLILSLLVALVAASPIDKRQTIRLNANEFVNGGCRDTILFFARGTTEGGNMGSVVGPPLANGLKDALGDANVAVQGIDYPAALAGNFVRGGADPGGIQTMADLLTQAATQCPDSKLVASGYSQGAALVHRAVEDLPQNVKDQMVAAVTFGDTQNQQDNGQIPNFDPAKTLVICNAGDAVCRGTLTILPAHLAYGARADEGVDFITGKVGAA